MEWLGWLPVPLSTVGRVKTKTSGSSAADASLGSTHCSSIWRALADRDEEEAALAAAVALACSSLPEPAASAAVAPLATSLSARATSSGVAALLLSPDEFDGSTWASSASVSGPVYASPAAADTSAA